MRPGRLPKDHPLEQQARDQLREKKGTKPEPPPTRPAWKPQPTQQRWGKTT